MTPQRQIKYSKKLIMRVGMGATTFLLLFGSLSWGHEDEGVRGDPVLTPCETQALNEGKSRVKHFNAPDFAVFTSGKGDYKYEVPEKWTSPKDLHDPAFEAIFVGPSDKIHHQSVFITVGRYPQSGKVASLNSVLSQLKREHGKQILETQPLLIDRHPARILRIEERLPISMGMQQKMVQLALCEQVALIEYEGEVYVLEYVSSPQLYEEYLPIFEHMVNSFHFASGKTKK